MYHEAHDEYIHCREEIAPHMGAQRIGGEARLVAPQAAVWRGGLLGLGLYQAPTMIEVSPGLFVGSEHNYEGVVRRQSGWAVVHACKEPYHRNALGYTGRAAPKTHPEYLIARRGDRLVLNLVDAPDPAYIPKEVIDAALEFIESGLSEGKRVLVHCNEGYSRAPSVAFLYLVSRTNRFADHDVDAALAAFQLLYPPFNPAMGMRGFIHAHYGVYRRDKTQ